MLVGLCVLLQKAVILLLDARVCIMFWVCCTIFSEALGLGAPTAGRYLRPRAL